MMDSYDATKGRSADRIGGTTTSYGAVIAFFLDLDLGIDHA